MKKHLSDKKSTRRLCNYIRHQIRFGKNPIVSAELLLKSIFLIENGIWIGIAP